MNDMIENKFKYHAPREDQSQKYEKIRDEAKKLAYIIDDLCPESEEKVIAIREIEQAVMWANAAITRNE